MRHRIADLREKSRWRSIALLVLAALALMLLGASTAMAKGSTTLCKEDLGEACPEVQRIAHVHEASSSKATLLSSLDTVLCDVLFLGDVTSSGNVGNPLEILGHFSYSNCIDHESRSCSTTETSTHTLISALKLGHELADVTGSAEVLVECGAFIHCRYSGTGLTGHGLGPLLASSEKGQTRFEEQTVNKVSGFLCPKTAKLDILTSPLEATNIGDGEGLSSTSTSITTSLKGGGKEGAEITVAEGSKVKDTATLSGENASKATGTVDYAVYKDKECKELVSKAGEVTVKEGKIPDSEEKELEAGAVYYWQAKYLGDSMNKESISTCSKEVETVKAKVTLSTTLSGGGKEGAEITVAEGSKVKDQAILSGTKSGTAKGTIKYAVYKDKECKELASKAGEGEVSEGKAPASEEKELEAGAVYYWQAEYGGDSLHEASTSTCSKEVLTVKAKTTIETILTAEVGPGKEPVEGIEITAATGAGVVDTAVVSGTVSSTAAGTVTYKVYSDNECTHLVTDGGTVAVEGGDAFQSDVVEFKTGTYYWQVEYSGDSLHEPSTSPCGTEIVTVIAATSLTTSLSGDGQEDEKITVGEGIPVSDMATLSGANAFKATGTVKYSVYSDPECKGLVKEAGEVSVKGEGVPPSSEVELEEGIYYWQAEFSGDSSNYGSTTICGEEVEVVTAQITTRLSGEEESDDQIRVFDGAMVSDEATLHGEHASEATGTVKYSVYSDPECKELVKEAGEVNVEEAGEVPISEEVELKTGIYYWQAEYSGDKENPPAKSICGSEVAVVVTSTLLTTSLTDGSYEGTEIEVKEGTEVSGQATLTGVNASAAEGYVEYTVYADSKCQEPIALAGTMEVIKGNIPASSKVALPVGTYYWQATYSGDGQNDGSTSACGSEVEIVTTPLTTTLSGGEQVGEEIEVSENTPVSDEATLHGEHAAEATGTVKYSVYSDPECEELVKEVGEVNVEGEDVPPSNEVKLEEGIYYWQAKYSGDGKNPAATSTCGAVQVIIGNPPFQYAALGDSYSSGEGTKNYYSPTKRWLAVNFNICHRSSQAWPARVAEAVYGANSGVTAENKVFLQQPEAFIFRACSNAIMANLWSQPPNTAAEAATMGQSNELIIGHPWLPTPAQNLWLELPGGVLSNPLQRNKQITLVTMTIGGNNAGFGAIVLDCIERLPGYSLEKCQETIATWRNTGFPWIEADLPNVLNDVHLTAPRARIRVPLYPRPLNIVPNRNIPVDPFGVFRVNNIVERGNETAAKSIERFVRELDETINRTVNTWATNQRVNARAVPQTIDAFRGHQLGDPAPRWINGISLSLAYPWVFESFHPNCDGYIAIAKGVLADLEINPLPWMC